MAHNINGDRFMINHNDYFYKGYDIINKNRMEKLLMEYSNPYGYNLESNCRRLVNIEVNLMRTNQDVFKTKNSTSKKS